MSDTTRLAFDNAWALQSKTGPAAGAWVWQNFDYTPWESKESEYYWAAMMAEVVASAPDNYRNDPEIIGNLAALRVYLRGHYDEQPLLNKIVVLWASAQFSGLLTPPQRKSCFWPKSTVATRRRRLEPCGPWNMATARQDSPGNPLGRLRDRHYVLALEENHIAMPMYTAAFSWLIANQDKTTGAWPAWSLNKNRDPKSNVGHFHERRRHRLRGAGAGGETITRV